MQRFAPCDPLRAPIAALSLLTTRVHCQEPKEGIRPPHRLRDR